jgi:hypothetical protein
MGSMREFWSQRGEETACGRSWKYGTCRLPPAYLLLEAKTAPQLNVLAGFERYNM